MIYIRSTPKWETNRVFKLLNFYLTTGIFVIIRRKSILNECVKLFSGQIPSVSRVAPTRYRHERACTEHSIESVKVCSAHENKGMN